MCRRAMEKNVAEIWIYSLKYTWLPKAPNFCFTLNMNLISLWWICKEALNERFYTLPILRFSLQTLVGGIEKKRITTSLFTWRILIVLCIAFFQLPLFLSPIPIKGMNFTMKCLLESSSLTLPKSFLLFTHLTSGPREPSSAFKD